MEENKLITIDASVLLKWLIAESEDMEQAVLLRTHFEKKKVEFIVPSFCFAEVCNILYRKVPHAAIEFYSYILELQITEHQLSFNIVNIAFKLMEQYHAVSFYDASYHALAILENGTFITADKKYYEKTRKEGHIMLLKNYGKKK